MQVSGRRKEGRCNSRRFLSLSGSVSSSAFLTIVSRARSSSSFGKSRVKLSMTRCRYSLLICCTASETCIRLPPLIGPYWAVLGHNDGHIAPKKHGDGRNGAEVVGEEMGRRVSRNGKFRPR